MNYATLKCLQFGFGFVALSTTRSLDPNNTERRAALQM